MGQWTGIPKLREWAVYRGRAGGEKLPAPTLQQVPLLRTAFNTTSLVTQCQWKRGGGHGTLKSIRCQEADTPSTSSGTSVDRSGVKQLKRAEIRTFPAEAGKMRHPGFKS